MGLQLQRLHIVSEPFQGEILYFQFGVNCMKKLLILGAGAGGTMIATKMRKLLSEREWEITLIDRDPVHHYQPGWLLIPFGVDTPQG